MSINIVKSTSTNISTTSNNTKKMTVEEALDIYDISKNASKQPRDEKGRFASTSSKTVKTKEEKPHLSPVNANRIKETAPYVANFIEFNAIVRQSLDFIANVYYLKKDTDNYYIFRTLKDEYFGFHLDCGELVKVMDSTPCLTLIIHSLNYWDEIQMA